HWIYAASSKGPGYGQRYHRHIFWDPFHFQLLFAGSFDHVHLFRSNTSHHIRAIVYIVPWHLPPQLNTYVQYASPRLDNKSGWYYTMFSYLACWKSTSFYQYVYNTSIVALCAHNFQNCTSGIFQSNIYHKCHIPTHALQ